ncbi:uncharacterized protein HMPREF1541_04221 [Cyphellophora europaea CBS 101466]|uniref:Uncharacterized protein n=1 Tax=Cyphellophora europaea (strain CBS 101466) TaxID=1220924 RepID=W2S113_CYPE1|nr:uncharacterized protein HMPREF1541_04221 [Cyphellophora europaea CBS 101466]ETN42280.1 hypothetical protein HMPREF1541_04221 [Cyphellophora europaea CBS 101466]
MRLQLLKTSAWDHLSRVTFILCTLTSHVATLCAQSFVILFLVSEALAQELTAMPRPAAAAAALGRSPLLNDAMDVDREFNEDECRDFLNAVGDKVVNSYIYSIGMEEAYSSIWWKYGPDGASDAISLLHDILEEDDTAGAGLGLDTDIWRPWKKNFRLRNINPQNPWVPHIGVRILPPATPTQVRKIRALNFLRATSAASSISEGGDQSAASASEAAASQPTTNSSHEHSLAASPNYFGEHAHGPSPKSDGAGGNRIMTPAFAHQRYRTLFATGNTFEESPPGETTNGRQDLGRITRLDSILSHRPTISSASSSAGACIAPMQIDSSDLSPAVHEAWIALTAGALDNSGPGEAASNGVATLRPLRYIPGSEAADFAVYAEQNEAKHTTDNEQSENIAIRQASTAVDNFREDVRRSHDFPEVSKPKQLCLDVGRDEALGLHRLQQAHRNAALLAGEIRTPVTPSHNHRSSNREAKTNDNTEKEHTEEDSGRAESASHGQPEKRKSHIARLLSLFRFGEKKERTELRRSFSIGRDHSALCFLESSSASPKRKVSDRRPRAMTISAGYDGTCSPRSTSSSGYYNKPLPLSPSERAQAASSRTQSSSPSRMRSSHANPPLTASSASTQASSASSKQRFRNTTRDLLDSSEMDVAPILPVDFVSHRSKASHPEPQKYVQEALPRLSYSSDAARNPYSDAPILVSAPSTYAPRNIVQHFGEELDSEVTPVPKLPGSHSDPYTDELSTAGLPAHGHYGPSMYVHTSSSASPKQPFLQQRVAAVSSRAGLSSNIEQPSTDLEESRGRMKARAQTPVHQNESSPLSVRSPPKPAKRSQSPMKRLLGLGKKTPVKDPKRSTSGTRDPTPGSSAKKSLKEWSHKIKHGFLAADMEEQQHESHMEDYATGKSAPELLAPSTFPISLDPSYQARLQADLEMMLVISANRFLVREAEQKRISRTSIDKFRHDWESKNLAQVVEYQFDMRTQRALILDNLRTIEFCGSIARDPVALTAALHAWGVMANEMLVRTFCVGDSVIRKWLNDSQRILEMLDAPPITFAMFDKMFTKALLVIKQRQQMAIEYNAETEANSASEQSEGHARSHSRNPSESSYAFRLRGHNRSVSNDSYIHGLYGSMAAQLEALEATPSEHVPSSRTVNIDYGPNTIPQPRVQHWDAVTAIPNASSSALETSNSATRETFDKSRGNRDSPRRRATPAARADPFDRRSPSRGGIREV